VRFTTRSRWCVYLLYATCTHQYAEPVLPLATYINAINMFPSLLGIIMSAPSAPLVCITSTFFRPWLSLDLTRLRYAYCAALQHFLRLMMQLYRTLRSQRSDMTAYCHLTRKWATFARAYISARLACGCCMKKREDVNTLSTATRM
jgi:hypothetical protein